MDAVSLITSTKRNRKREYNREWITKKRQSRLNFTETSSSESSENEDFIEHVAPRQESLADDGMDDERDAVDIHVLNYEQAYTGDRDDLSLEDQQTRDTVSVNMSSDSDSVDEVNDHVHDSLTSDLREWTTRFEVTAIAVDNLLKMLKHHGFQDIPGTTRTLLKTPRTVETRSISAMDYFHFGLHFMMNRCLEKISKINVDHLVLSLNIDGFPLFKSTNSSVWPVLCCITNITPLLVFPIAIAIGKSKPANLDFLQDAINDINVVIQEGFVYAQRQFRVSLSCVICDAPAKAMVKFTKQYSGYYGCDRCCQRGKFVGRMIYPIMTDLELRTNESFRNNEQQEHHKGLSPFLQLPSLNMVEDFPVDYMHQVCLGVMKKLLLLWIKGPRQLCRLSAGQVTQVSTRLIEMRQNIPREFARKPRRLDELDRWKATELRQFLLYTGKFVLKDVLPEANFNHFMTLSIAMCILVNLKLVAQHGVYAHQLLLHFVSKSGQLYGPEFLVYNVHSLLHLTRDAQRFGCLDNCAAWKFENHMQVLKRKVRTGKNPAVQLVKRILETTYVEEIPRNKKKIHCRYPDSFYKMADDKYCEVVRVENKQESTYLCRVFHTPEAYFEQPCNSRLVGICKFQEANYEMKIIQARQLVVRCIMMYRGGAVIFLPLLHDF